MISNKYWLLLTVGMAKGRGLSPVQINKSLFLMKMEAEEFVGSAFYQFEPYNYGPFCSDIYSDLNDLIENGFMISSPGGMRFNIYSLTPLGLEKCDELKNNIDERATSFLQETVSWVLRKSFPSLLRAIYSKYPEYKSNSIFAG